MSPENHELTDADIKEFLERAPLYAWREFKKPRINRSNLWIKEVDAYCDVCEQVRPFQDMRPRGGGAGMAVKALESGTSYFEFSCVSCRKSHRLYLVEQVLDEGFIRIQKFGELPRSKLNRDRDLQRFLKDDRDNYEKAIVCLSHEYGIAAFAYFRRIVENNIYRLLDLVQEDARSSEAENADLEAIDELRKESPMSEKIKVANRVLPEYLKPDGLNPLERLYQALSQGVHSLSDEECLTRANEISVCLAFLVSELSTRKAHREKFKRMVEKL